MILIVTFKSKLHAQFKSYLFAPNSKIAVDKLICCPRWLPMRVMDSQLPRMWYQIKAKELLKLCLP